jgi:hypothetical protein
VALILFLKILLAYNSCIGRYIVIFTYVFTIYLIFTSSKFSRFPPTSLLRIISTSFLLLFSYMDKKIHPLYSSSFPLSFCPPASHWYPPWEKTYSTPCPSFF